MSDIRRFDSFPRYGVVGFTIYGNERIRQPCRNMHFDYTSPDCYVSDSFSVFYRHLVFRFFRKRPKNTTNIAENKRKMDVTK
jgi:hypothetical protein